MYQLAPGLDKPHEVHTDPLVQLPLDGILDLRYINLNTEPDVIYKLAEGALDLPVKIIDEDIEQYHNTLFWDR